jgi:hypothetical protein
MPDGSVPLSFRTSHARQRERVHQDDADIAVTAEEDGEKSTKVADPGMGAHGRSEHRIRRSWIGINAHPTVRILWTTYVWQLHQLPDAELDSAW